MLCPPQFLFCKIPGVVVLVDPQKCCVNPGAEECSEEFKSPNTNSPSQMGPTFFQPKGGHTRTQPLWDPGAPPISGEEKKFKSRGIHISPTTHRKPNGGSRASGNKNMFLPRRCLFPLWEKPKFSFPLAFSHRTGPIKPVYPGSKIRPPQLKG